MSETATTSSSTQIALVRPLPVWSDQLPNVAIKPHLKVIDATDGNEKRLILIEEETNLTVNFTNGVLNKVNKHFTTFFQGQVERIQRVLGDISGLVSVCNSIPTSGIDAVTMSGSRAALVKQVQDMTKIDYRSLRECKLECDFDVTSELYKVAQVKILLANMKKTYNPTIVNTAKVLYDEYLVHVSKQLFRDLSKALLDYQQKSSLELNVTVSEPIFVGELAHLRTAEQNKTRQNDYVYKRNNHAHAEDSETVFTFSEPVYHGCRCNEHTFDGRVTYFQFMGLEMRTRIGDAKIVKPMVHCSKPGLLTHGRMCSVKLKLLPPTIRFNVHVTLVETPTDGVNVDDLELFVTRLKNTLV